ncbi:MAG: C45 family peptidase [Pseudomonadota bacterium]
MSDKESEIDRRGFFKATTAATAAGLTASLTASASNAQSIGESGDGTLLENNGFLIVVLEGTSFDMGVQYGSMMAEHMQAAWDVLIAPGLAAGAITDAEVERWSQRAYTTCTTRARDWYDGVSQGSGWPINQVCFLDSFMEFGIYQAKLHSFAGCTSIMSWGTDTADGNMYIGRNMDWTDIFNEFPQVLTVRKPSGNAYKTAVLGWPGIYTGFTIINDQGVYLDVHDGSSMGGSVVYEERAATGTMIVDILEDVASREALVSRINGISVTVSAILSVADGQSASSVECSSLAGNRERVAEGDSYVVVNTFFEPSWGLGIRETVSNSLKRFRNMTDRLADNAGSMNAAKTREIMDLRLFNPDGSFAENGGATKPANQDADLTNHQMVTDIANQTVWLKVPVPEYFADWTEVDLRELWAS